MLIEAYPLVLLGFAISKRLDRSRWLMAILAALTQLTLAFQNFTGQGERFTHWTISRKDGIAVVYPGRQSVQFVAWNLSFC